MMIGTENVFEQNWQEYCDQLAGIDYQAVIDTLGLVSDDDRLLLPFFTKQYVVSHNAIVDMEGNRPDYTSFVVMAKYLLLCPEQAHFDPKWVAFRDFKRASHFTNVNFFASDTERAIEKHFSGRLEELAEAGRQLGGVDHDTDMPYDLSMHFQALPRLSLLLLFNDSDDEFPAKCTVLFQRHAELYLDPESLAMTGAVLARSLRDVA
ncbi:MAG: DUF3786 domain-containing protein [Desulfovermiculus sp.]